MNGIPMSAEEFARRQKEAKQRDREQKNQAAQGLTSYRGGVKEEELKLKAIKDEERQKQRDAAKLLQGYRGGLKEEDVKLRAMKEEDRQKQLAAEQLLHSYQKTDEPDAKKRPERIAPESPYPAPVTVEEDHTLQNITPGSVSAKMEQFNSPSRQTPTLGSSSKPTDSASCAPRGTPVVKEDIPTMQSLDGMGAFPIPAAPTTASEPVVIPDNKEDSNAEEGTPALEEEGEPVEDASPGKLEIAVEPMIPQPVAVETPSAEPKTIPTAVEEAPAAEETAVPKPTESPVDTPVVEPPAETPALVEETPPSAEEPAEDSTALPEKPVDPAPVVAPAAAVPTPSAVQEETNVRFDVYFSFGIVTQVDDPRYESYMSAVATIVQDAVEAQPDITYDPSHPPYVSNQKWDDTFIDPNGRSSAKRVLVTAGVPLLLSNGLPSKTAQTVVTQGLQGAIQSRTFLRLVRREI